MHDDVRPSLPVGPEVLERDPELPICGGCEGYDPKYVPVGGLTPPGECHIVPRPRDGWPRVVASDWCWQHVPREDVRGVAPESGRISWRRGKMTHEGHAFVDDNKTSLCGAAFVHSSESCAMESACFRCTQLVKLYQ